MSNFLLNEKTKVTASHNFK